MVRQASSSAPGGLDRVLRPPSAPGETDREPDDWGATAMPSWLDTAAGRSAWAGRRSSPEPSGRESTSTAAERVSDDPADTDNPSLRWEEVLDDEDCVNDRRRARPAAARWTGYDGDAEPDDSYPDDSYPDDSYPDDSYPDEDHRDHGSRDRDRDAEWDEEWAAPRRRFVMVPSAAIGLLGIGVVACVIAGFALLRGSEPAVPLVDLPASAGPTAAGPTAAGESAVAPAEASRIVVSVAGLVHKPGLVSLAPNSRVAQALDLAGGARPNADVLGLNLAQVLRDGDQVLVGTRANGADSVRSAVVTAGSGAAGGSGAVDGGPAGGPAAAGPVNLNTATAAELDALPGVGPVTAQAIIGWRQQHGDFTSVDQLAEVDGIGPGKLAKLRAAVTVG